MKTNNNEILAIIEDEIKKEETENKALKSALGDLAGTESATLVIPDKANFRMGNSRFNRTIPTDSTFDKLYKTLTQSQADFPNKFGFTLGDHKVWIRSDSDVNNMFRNHFGRGEEFIKFIDTNDQEFCEINELKINEIKDPSDDSVVIYLGLLKCDWFIYLTLSKKLPYSGLKTYLSKIAPKLKDFKFIDCDDMPISTNDEDSWEYIKLDAATGYEHGKYCAIIIE